MNMDTLYLFWDDHPGGDGWRGPRGRHVRDGLHHTLSGLQFLADKRIQKISWGFQRLRPGWIWIWIDCVYTNMDRLWYEYGYIGFVLRWRPRWCRLTKTMSAAWPRRSANTPDTLTPETWNLKPKAGNSWLWNLNSSALKDDLHHTISGLQFWPIKEFKNILRLPTPKAGMDRNMDRLCLYKYG